MRRAFDAVRRRPSSAAVAVRASAAWSRSTSVAKTSSNDGRILAGARDLATARADAPRRRPASRVPASSTTTREVARARPGGRSRTTGERRAARPRRSGRGLDLDDVAAHRLAPQVVRRRERDQPALGDQRDRVALLGLVDVLGRHQQRPAGVAQAVELVPDAAAEERIDPGGRLVEEEQRRVVDEGAGQLEPALHPARQAPGAAAADLPQVDQLEHLARPPPARPEQHPEQRRHEVDVLAGGQVRVERERWGM